MYRDVKNRIISGYIKLKEFTKVGAAFIVVSGVIGFFYSINQISENSRNIEIIRGHLDDALRDNLRLSMNVTNYRADHKILLERYENMKAFYNRRELNK